MSEAFDSFDDAGIDLEGRNRGQVKVRCPQPACRNRRHQNDKPLSVNVDEGVWHCHHCGWEGNLRTHRPRPSERIYVRPIVPDSMTLFTDHRTFLTDRGIDPDVAESAGVYSDRTESGTARLNFPYYKHGEVVAIKYRFANKGFGSTSESEWTIYGHDDCVGAEKIVICEGELDRLALNTAGITAACSVPHGAPNPGSKADAKLGWLAGCEEMFKSARRIILATDNDENGQVLADELARRIGPEKCSRVQWPEGIKDANDALRIRGAQALCDFISSARPEPVSGIHDGNTLEEDMIRLFVNGREKGMDFGYPDFDKIYSVLPGYMTIVTGHAGHGKSTALDQLLVRLAQRHGIHTTIYSPEQQPYDFHQEVLIEQYVGMPFRDGPTPRMSQRQMLLANQWVADHFSFITPETPTVDTILELARVQVYRVGAKGLVIDPWNEIEHTRPAEYSETEYVSLVLGKLRRFARNHKVHLWLVAHPTKMERKADGTEQEPGLMNVSGSVNFRNKADFGLTVYRTASDGPVDLIVTKSRRIDAAKQGRVQFRFDPVTKRLNEIGAVR